MIKKNFLNDLLLKKSFENKKRLSRKELSIKTGIPIWTLNRIAVKPTYKINSEHIAKLCNFFNCQISDLIEFDDPPAEFGREFIRLQKEN